MNREGVLKIVREARDHEETPDLGGVDLREADLYGVDLREADLYGVNLWEADLNWANLRWADLRWADLRWANLSWADLYGADLYGADLARADLSGANLYGVNLYGANLSGVNLYGVNLYGAKLCGAAWDGLYVDGIHPYRCLLAPTPDGWTVTIGCWSGTVAELRALISRDDGWPEATGDQIAERRPRLLAFCDLCDARIAAHPGVIDDLAARWSA